MGTKEIVAKYKAGPPEGVDYSDDEVVWLHGLLEELVDAAVPETTRQNRAFWDGFLYGIMFTAVFIFLAYVLAEWLR